VPGLTGAVQFTNNGSTLGAGQALGAGGIVNLTTSSLTTGAHIIAANYSGNGNFKPSSGILPASTRGSGQIVDPVPTPTPTPKPTATPTPAPTATPVPTPRPARALNLSTRLRVGTGNDVLINGFISTGIGSKKVALRGIGPSLNQAGVKEALADPVLELHGNTGSLITSNDNWKSTQQSTIEATTLAPKSDLESAIVGTLPSGAYTAIILGKNGGTGVGLVEVYDLDNTEDTQLANISTRGLVGIGDDVMIGGFILGRDPGSAKVVVRGLGPSLAAAGLPNFLADPVLALHDGNGTLIKTNDNWQDDASSAALLTASGLAPQSGRESAMFVTLPPGAYTAILSGKNGGTGTALVEIYTLP
jgi:hypothetical protein